MTTRAYQPLTNGQWGVPAPLASPSGSGQPYQPYEDYSRSNWQVPGPLQNPNGTAYGTQFGGETWLDQPINEDLIADGQGGFRAPGFSTAPKPLNWPGRNGGGGGGFSLPNYGQSAYNMYAGINQNLGAIDAYSANAWQQARTTMAQQDAYALAEAKNQQRFNTVLGNPGAYQEYSTTAGTKPGWSQGPDGGWIYDVNGTPGSTTPMNLTPEQQRHNELVRNANGGLKDLNVRGMEAYDELGNELDAGLGRLDSTLNNSITNQRGILDTGLAGTRSAMDRGLATQRGTLNRGLSRLGSTVDRLDATVEGGLGESDQRDGYWARYNRGLENLKGAGEQENADILARAKKRSAREKQNLARRGLPSSTIEGNVERANSLDTEAEIRRNNESVRQMRLTTDANLSGDALRYAGDYGKDALDRRTNAINRRLSVDELGLDREMDFGRYSTDKEMAYGQYDTNERQSLERQALANLLSTQQYGIGQNLNLGREQIGYDQSSSKDILNFIAGVNNPYPDFSQYLRTTRGMGQYG